MAVEIQRDRFSGDIGPRVKIIRQQRNDAVVCRAVKGLAHRHIVFLPVSERRIAYFHRFGKVDNGLAVRHLHGHIGLAGAADGGVSGLGHGVVRAGIAADRAFSAVVVGVVSAAADVAVLADEIRVEFVGIARHRSDVAVRFHISGPLHGSIALRRRGTVLCDEFITVARREQTGQIAGTVFRLDLLEFSAAQQDRPGGLFHNERTVHGDAVDNGERSAVLNADAEGFAGQGAQTAVGERNVRAAGQ